MKTFTLLCWLTCALSICITQELSATDSPAFNSIRIVHFQYSFLCDSLLDRIKRNNYNYAVVTFTFRRSNDIVGDGDIYDNLREDVRDACRALDSRGVKIIPMFPLSSKWAMQWLFIKKYENPLVGMNTITANNDLPCIVGENPMCSYQDNIETANMGCNSWANEPEGVDKSVVDIFKAINDGFSDADVNYELEYIHIHHDEPQFLNWLLMAGVGAACGTAYPYRGNFARGAVSDADVSYISTALNQGYSIAQAYQRLLADELYRRVLQAEQVFGSNVKLMFYADSFDDQSWGGVDWRVNLGNNSIMQMHPVIDLPGLNELQKQKFKENTIPIIWNYDGKVAAVKSVFDWLSKEDYNSNEAFERFSSRGYNFLYIGALQYGTSSENQINEFYTASMNYRDHCLGYFAAAWDVDYNPVSPDIKWNIIEYMADKEMPPTRKNQPDVSQAPEFLLSSSSISYSGLYLRFSLFQSERIKINVFNSSGRFVTTLVDRNTKPGNYCYHFPCQSGLYHVYIQAGSERQTFSIPVLP